MKRSGGKTVKFHAHLRAIQTRIRVPEPPPVARHVPEQAVAADKPSASQEKQEFIVGLLTEIKRYLDQVASTRAENVAEMQELAIELAMIVASHILKQKLDRNELAMDDLVAAAVEKLGLDEPLRVKVNPQDQTVLRDFPPANLEPHVEIIADDDLPRGSCVVLNSERGLLSSLEGRLENIRETLLQGIEYARIEQRTAIDLGGSEWGVSDTRKPA